MTNKISAQKGGLNRTCLLTWKAIKPNPSVSSEPSTFALLARETLLSALSEFVPLSEQFHNMLTDVRFELEYALEGEDVGDDLALSCMIGSITGSEDVGVDGREYVVEIALQSSVPMGVDDLEGIWIGD